MAGRRFRNKLQDIQAMRWTGYNESVLRDWMKSDFQRDESQVQITGKTYTAKVWVAANCEWAQIETGEWIIKDRSGFRPCGAREFAATYEEV